LQREEARTNEGHHSGRQDREEESRRSRLAAGISRCQAEGRRQLAGSYWLLAPSQLINSLEQKRLSRAIRNRKTDRALELVHASRRSRKCTLRLKPVLLCWHGASELPSASQARLEDRLCPLQKFQVQLNWTLGD